MALCPQDLVARYRIGILGGSVPVQDDLPVSQFGGQVGGGLRVRRRHYHGYRGRRRVHRQVRGRPAQSAGADGLDPVHVGPSASTVVSV